VNITYSQLLSLTVGGGKAIIQGSVWELKSDFVSREHEMFVDEEMCMSFKLTREVEGMLSFLVEGAVNHYYNSRGGRG